MNSWLIRPLRLTIFLQRANSYTRQFFCIPGVLIYVIHKVTIIVIGLDHRVNKLFLDFRQGQKGVIAEMLRYVFAPSLWFQQGFIITPASCSAITERVEAFFVSQLAAVSLFATADLFAGLASSAAKPMLRVSIVQGTNQTQIYGGIDAQVRLSLTRAQFALDVFKVQLVSTTLQTNLKLPQATKCLHIPHQGEPFPQRHKQFRECRQHDYDDRGSAHSRNVLW